MADAARIVPSLLSEAARNIAQGRLTKARRLCERAVAMDRGNPDAHMLLGDVLARRRDPAGAVRSYARALEIAPRHVGALTNLGLLHREQGNFAAAVVALRKAHEVEPASDQLLYNLARTLFDAGLFEDAVAQFRRLVTRKSDIAEYWLSLGGALEQARRFDEAIDSYARAIELKPDWPLPRVRLGRTLQIVGDLDRAVEVLDQAIAIAPRDPRANFLLAGMPSSGEGEWIAIERIQTAFEYGADPDAQAYLHFAAGKLYERLRDYSSAYRHYAEGNRIRKASLTFDHEELRLWGDRLTEAFSPELYEGRPARGDATAQPVFIVGMLGSGTTLVEQICAAHPAVAGGGDISTMGGIEREISLVDAKGGPFTDVVGSLSDERIAELARRYLDALPAAAREAQRFTDKLAANFARLGLIALLFPNARVIACRRQPLATATSILFENVDATAPYAYDVDDLAALYAYHDRLMAHWRKVLPIALMEVDYEALVASPEEEIRAIISFLDLPWDDACLGFHEVRNPVTTPAYYRVRQPIDDTSVGRWRLFEKHLGPLKEALARHGVITVQ